MADDERRRRRVRGAGAGAGGAGAGGAGAGGASGVPERGTPERGVGASRAHVTRPRRAYDESRGTPVADPSLGASSGAGDDRDERSLRGLVGGGSSQLSVRAALRARDASRPSDADLAAVAATLTIVHRGWAPRDQ